MPPLWSFNDHTAYAGERPGRYRVTRAITVPWQTTPFEGHIDCNNPVYGRASLDRWVNELRDWWAHQDKRPSPVMETA